MLRPESRRVYIYLGRAVRTTPLAPDSHIASDASHHNNAPTLRTIRNHLSRRRLSRIIHAFNINIHQSLKLLQRRIEELDIPVRACTGHADIKLAAKILHERLEAGGYGRRRRNINRVRRRPHFVGRCDQVETLAWRYDVEDGDVCARFGEALGKRETAASGAAGDERGTACE